MQEIERKNSIYAVKHIKSETDYQKGNSIVNWIKRDRGRRSVTRVRGRTINRKIPGIRQREHPSLGNQLRHR